MGYLLAFLIILILILVWQLSSKSYEYKVDSNFKKLWLDHVIYIIAYEEAFLTKSEKTTELYHRLMQNAKSLGNSFSQIYGNRCGDKLTEKLEERTKIFQRVLEDWETTGSDRLYLMNRTYPKNDLKLLYKNGFDLAQTLNQINSKWAPCKLHAIFLKQTNMLLQNMHFCLDQQYQISVEILDKMKDEICAMVDYMTERV